MKVKFGLKNAYYAPITESEGTVTYGTPVHIPGAVSISLDAVGDDTEFYADDMLYFNEKVNNGYDGSMEFAMITDDFKKDCLGETLDSNNVLAENANAVKKNFALLCEMSTDDGARKFVFYNCSASRPSIAATTKSASKEIQTETIDLSIRPNANAQVKMYTTPSTPASVLNAWYSAVYEETASV